MAITFPTAWPAALTDAAWQKKKSFMDKAKSKTKTGLGASLTTAQKAWGLVKFDNLIATKVPMTTGEQADQAKVAAQNHLNTVAAAASRAALDAAAKAATTKNIAGLSSTAKAAAATIEKGLLAQAAHIRDIKLDDFDTAKSDLIQMLALSKMSAVKKGIVKGDQFIKTVKATPTRKTFNDDIQEACRPLTVPLGTIGTTISGKADPKALGKNLEKWADGKNQLPKYASAQVEKTKVLEALDIYEDALNGIRRWAA
ncbi:MAG: hypothetical protein ABI847_10365 [Anaerolineales bacterium]